MADQISEFGRMSVRPAARRIQFECPVDGCGWSLDVADQSSYRITVPDLGALPDQDHLIDRLRAGITEQAHRERDQTEASLREHLGTHDVLDFVRTIHGLRCDLAQFEQRAADEEMRRVRAHAHDDSLNIWRTR